MGATRAGLGGGPSACTSAGAHSLPYSLSKKDGVASTRTVGTTDMPGPSVTSVGGVVENDLHRHALDDLDIVAGGVLGGQQRERRPRSRLDAGDMAAHGAVRISVDFERDRLAGPHVVELRLLEIRRDPDRVRYEHGEVRARLRELTDCRTELDGTAGLRLS